MTRSQIQLLQQYTIEAIDVCGDDAEALGAFIETCALILAGVQDTSALACLTALQARQNEILNFKL